MKKRTKIEVQQSRMLKELVRHIPRTWEGMQDLAHQANVSPVTLWYWVEGRTISPRINTMIKVATALGYDIGLTKPARQLRLVR